MTNLIDRIDPDGIGTRLADHETLAKLQAARMGMAYGTVERYAIEVVIDHHIGAVDVCLPASMARLMAALDGR